MFAASEDFGEESNQVIEELFKSKKQTVSC
jgi:hypothetical protein